MEDALANSADETGGKETRLMISRIVNENFKSYAGKQELGPFHKVCQLFRDSAIQEN